MLFELLSKLINKKDISKNTIFLVGMINNKTTKYFIVFQNNKYQIVNKEFKVLKDTNVNQMYKYKDKILFCNLNEYLYYLINIQSINKKNYCIENNVTI